MAEKVDPQFPHSIFRFIHKPIREKDTREGGRFLERFVYGPQIQFERAYAKLREIADLHDAAKTPQPQILKSIVGFTRELNSITDGLPEADIRKLITLAVALWKKKGLEVGYRDIIRLFTGKNSRTFNWFDFRYIVGEQSLAQEELGEDSWIISTPLVFSSTPAGNVVGLWPFEANLKDRSVTKNDAVAHGPVFFYGPGPLGGSDNYLALGGDGAVSAPHTAAYDFSESFTIEGFVRTGTAQDAVLFSKTDGIRTIEIRYNSGTNSIIYTLDDGSNVYSETLVAASDLDDGTWRHFGLIVDRDEATARLFFNSNDATAGVDITAMGDLTSTGRIYLGASGPSTDRFTGHLDAFRLSLSAQYDVTAAFLPVPASTFIEYREEQLDEFYMDVRIVDEGDLNRTLVRRILNLMRPPSERLRLIYIKFFESFQFGKGGFRTLAGAADVVDNELVMPPAAVEEADTLSSPDWTDIVLQVRLKASGTDGRFGVRFLVQDDDNYYLAVLDVVAAQMELYKVTGGVAASLAAPAPVDVWPDAYYIVTVITDRNQISGETMIRTLLDGNVAHKVFDIGYVAGTFAVETFADSDASVSHVELFTMPLDIETVLPNFVG